MTTTTHTPTKSNNKPAYIAYTVRERGDQDGFWSRIGVAFPHADGKGYSLVLDAIPVDGRITLRIPAEKPAE